MNIKKIALSLISAFTSVATAAEQEGSSAMTSAKSIKSTYMNLMSSANWMYMGIAIVLVLLLVLLVWVKRRKK